MGSFNHVEAEPDIFSVLKPRQLNISSHGQEACGIPFEQIKEVMEWLGLSLTDRVLLAACAGVSDSANVPVGITGSALENS